MPTCPRPPGLLDRIWIEHLRGVPFPEPPPSDVGDDVVRAAFAARRDEQAAVLDQLIAVREAARAPFDIDTDPVASW
jgi:hypothetical protein